MTDSHLQRYIDLDSWRAFVASLRRASIDYAVVADRQTMPRRIGLSFRANDNEFPFSRRLVEEYGQKLYQNADLALYRLRLPAEDAL